MLGETKTDTDKKYEFSLDREGGVQTLKVVRTVTTAAAIEAPPDSKLIKGGKMAIALSENYVVLTGLKSHADDAFSSNFDFDFDLTKLKWSFRESGIDGESYAVGEGTNRLLIIDLRGRYVSIFIGDSGKCYYEMEKKKVKFQLQNEKCKSVRLVSHVRDGWSQSNIRNRETMLCVEYQDSTRSITCTSKYESNSCDCYQCLCYSYRDSTVSIGKS